MTSDNVALIAQWRAYLAENAAESGADVLIADAILAAERAAYERAAQEAMKHFHPDESTSTWLLACETIAAAIRALASSGDGKENRNAD